MQKNKLRISDAGILDGHDISYKKSSEIYLESQKLIMQKMHNFSFDKKYEQIIYRMVHCSGNISITDKFEASGKIISAITQSTKKGKTILTDSKMVKAGILSRNLKTDNQLKVFLTKYNKQKEANLNNLTRSAYGLSLVKDLVYGSVVIIGQSPSCLLFLIDNILNNNWPKPEALIATPVGFVDAELSKRLLATSNFDFPWLTIHGSLGGSALAASAFNACFESLIESAKKC